jgi:TonB family protein
MESRYSIYSYFVHRREQRCSHEAFFRCMAARRLGGHPISIQVSRPLGLGLDEKAVEAVSKWRFKPAMKDGKPVPVTANIIVNFRLL